jgi:hypothetical protein
MKFYDGKTRYSAVKKGFLKRQNAVKNKRKSGIFKKKEALRFEKAFGIPKRRLKKPSAGKKNLGDVHNRGGDPRGHRGGSFFV